MSTYSVPSLRNVEGWPEKHYVIRKPFAVFVTADNLPHIVRVA